MTKHDPVLTGLAVLGLTTGAMVALYGIFNAPNPFEEQAPEPVPQPSAQQPEPLRQPSPKATHWKEMEDIAFAMLSGNRDGFEYDFHDCIRNEEKGIVVCVACYTHSELNYLGQQFLVCDLQSCARMHSAADLKMHGADLSYCERENQKRVK